MKKKLLAAVASVAFIAAGVAVAQESPKHDQRPAASEARPGATAEPGANPGARAEGERNEMKGQNNEMKGQNVERPRAAEAPAQERRAQDQGERQNGAAENRTAEPNRAQTPAARTGANEPRTGAKTGSPETRTGSAEAKPGAPENRTGAAETSPRGKRAGANEPPRANERAGARTAEQSAQHGPAQVRGNVRMSPEHATRVGEALRREMRPEHVDVDLRVGVRVPERIHVRPLPAEVVSIVPEYRGYDYFIDENDEIVFVSPESHEIVGMIEYEGRAAMDESVTRVRAARPCPPEE